MKKNNTTSADVWNEAPEQEFQKPLLKPQVPESASQFDLEGLMTDFPTATELQKFVFDETGIALNLKGRSNKLKYQIAMDVLNGGTAPAEMISSENPYVDKNDLVPEEDMKVMAPRSKDLPEPSDMQNMFHSSGVPHPDDERRANGARVTVCFRKYMNGIITYEIEGPVEPRPKGEKIDKFGRIRPEIITWVDPRTTEQMIVRPDGSITPVGQKLRALLKSQPVNKSNVWDTWVDREFVSVNQEAIENPWGTN